MTEAFHASGGKRPPELERTARIPRGKTGDGQVGRKRAEARHAQGRGAQRVPCDAGGGPYQHEVQLRACESGRRPRRARNARARLGALHRDLGSEALLGMFELSPRAICIVATAPGKALCLMNKSARLESVGGTFGEVVAKPSTAWAVGGERPKRGCIHPSFRAAGPFACADGEPAIISLSSPPRTSSPTRPARSPPPERRASCRGRRRSSARRRSRPPTHSSPPHSARSPPVGTFVLSGQPNRPVRWM